MSHKTILALMLALSACVPSQKNTPAKVPSSVAPKIATWHGAEMSFLLAIRGKIVIKNGCLAIQDSEGNYYLPVFVKDSVIWDEKRNLLIHFYDRKIYALGDDVFWGNFLSPIKDAYKSPNATLDLINGCAIETLIFM